MSTNRSGTSTRSTGALWTAVTALAAVDACTPRESGRDASPPSAAGSPAGSGNAAAFREREPERRVMVERQLTARDVKDERVLSAMRRVPRHRFVKEEDRDRAYGDQALPIVGGQTISQPYIVGFMTEAAGPKPGERCLEIGTGSGYQAAVLAELCGEVYSIEYLEEVAAFGRRNLEALGYVGRVVQLRVGDGYAGWPEAAPFDVILVTAAPERVPLPLLEQLAPGGRLVIPLGPVDGMQQLETWTRVGPGTGDAAFVKKTHFGVQFVPFLGR